MKKLYNEPVAEKLEFNYVLTTEVSGGECSMQGEYEEGVGACVITQAEAMG